MVALAGTLSSEQAAVPQMSPASASAMTVFMGSPAFLCGRRTCYTLSTLERWLRFPAMEKYGPGRIWRHTAESRTPCNALSCRCRAWLLGAGGHVGGEYIVGVSVEVLASSVVAHG